MEDTNTNSERDRLLGLMEDSGDVLVDIGMPMFDGITPEVTVASIDPFEVTDRDTKQPTGEVQLNIKYRFEEPVTDTGGKEHSAGEFVTQRILEKAGPAPKSGCGG